MSTRRIIKVGRSVECQFHLNSEKASSEHAWLIFASNSILLIDCGTTNGTRVKAQGLKKITQTIVSPTDSIFFADEQVSVREIMTSLPLSETSMTNTSSLEPTNNPNKEDSGFFSKLLQGDYGLAKTYWIFGVLVNVFLNLPFTIASGSELILLLVLYFPYQVTVLLGTWAAANRYQGARYWIFLAKLMTILSWAALLGGFTALVGLLD